MDRLSEIRVPTLVMAGRDDFRSRRRAGPPRRRHPRRAAPDHRTGRPQPPVGAAGRDADGRRGLPDRGPVPDTGNTRRELTGASRKAGRRGCGRAVRVVPTMGLQEPRDRRDPGVPSRPGRVPAGRGALDRRRGRLSADLGRVVRLRRRLRARQHDARLRQGAEHAADPRVTLLCYDPRQPLRYLEVRGTVVEMTEEGAGRHLDALASKYAGRPIRYFGDAILRASSRPRSQSCRIRPRHVVALDATGGGEGR